MWTAITAVVMFALAGGKARTGRALDNPVLQTEGEVTFVDGILATAVLVGLVLNALAGWWWADPAAGYVLVYYASARRGSSTPSSAAKNYACVTSFCSCLTLKRIGEGDGPTFGHETRR